MTDLTLDTPSRPPAPLLTLRLTHRSAVANHNSHYRSGESKNYHPQIITSSGTTDPESLKLQGRQRASPIDQSRWMHSPNAELKQDADARSFSLHSRRRRAEAGYGARMPKSPPLSHQFPNRKNNRLVRLTLSIEKKRDIDPNPRKWEMPQGLPYTGPPPPPLKLNGDAEIPDVPNTKKDPQSRRWGSQAPAFIQKIVQTPQPSLTPSRPKQEHPINNLISSGMDSKVNSKGSEAVDPHDEKTVRLDSKVDATGFVRDTD
ncbi:hypothetical protein MAPG_01638 [Magnaporthiopsis poae ATCC 64411]|uniref:Uncharacterized protein n=1 Tax=Magnaporthiopsis poae (strain ATCC 64411 / 73-15) TaxID=644358 RepID=A0A0C4DP83_MAGP6|nr:hypothetical protein MAPG_01638 [Magnaporthiopsis poae ATCC 64411]